MYTPTPGVFVNGLIIDGPDLLNEFGLIASEIRSVTTTLLGKIAEMLQDAKDYADKAVADANIDGGTV